jgi:Protein of unknown function (DUF1552)
MISIRTSATKARFSRRAFLRRVGASAALLPLLAAERARAVTPAGFPKRLITIAWSNGVAQPSFYPPADDPTASPIMQPLALLKSKVTLVAGIDYKIMVDNGFPMSGHFAFPTMFTGTYKNVGGENSTATGPSIDQVVSDAVAKQINLPVPLLNVTVQGKSTSFRADGTRNTGETDPGRLFKTLFESQALPSADLDVLRTRRKSVIDYVTSELSTYSARLGTDDRAKVATHLDSIRQLEASLTASTTGASCVPVDPGAPTEYQASMKAFSDLVAMAIRCDVTRTVSLVWADDGGSGPFTLPFLNLGGSSLSIGEVHAIAHQGADGYLQKTTIDTWYMTQLAYLAQALDATTENGRTALDNSLIVMGNDMGDGSRHTVSDVPFILVGGAGGALRTGRTVRAGSWLGKTGGAGSNTYWNGGNTAETSAQLLATVGNLVSAPAGTDRGSTSNNHLLASISNLMDVPATSFGTGYPGTLTDLE